ncbi:hypothetical protein AB0G31_09945, partial [Streptomyces fradiae]
MPLRAAGGPGAHPAPLRGARPNRPGPRAARAAPCQAPARAAELAELGCLAVRCDITDSEQVETAYK